MLPSVIFFAWIFAHSF